MTYNTLIVDDHPMIIAGYKLALQHIEEDNVEIKFSVKEAHDCDSAYQKILQASRGAKFDLIFLDIKLNPSKDGTILSGEDLGVKIRKLIPDSRIIVSTAYNNNLRLSNIIKSVDPDALLVKNDLTPENLIVAIIAVLNNETYYCNTTSKMMRAIIKNDFVLDEYDRLFLHELSKGTKMKDMPKKLPFSIGGLERRKRILKEIFNVQDRDDSKLIQLAREKGFI